MRGPAENVKAPSSRYGSPASRVDPAAVAAKPRLTPEVLVREIEEYCRTHADEKSAGKWARYFSEGYDAWGLLDKNHDIWTTQKAAWLEAYGTVGLSGFLKAGKLLMASGKYEEGSLAIQFLAAHKSQFESQHMPVLARWFEDGIRNWAHTDVLCSEVLGPLLKMRRLKLDDFTSWRTAAPKFQRRAVPVSMISLLAGTTELAPLLDFLRPMMLDEERVVHQGLGWFLREAWKKHTRPVEQYLLEWKEKSARLIYQYATEKMTAAQKSRYRRSGRG
ncbi:MAG: DNA alkylation repair protein [Bryobacterales bacterium]|nr:DNA alkylation repair protein [Bryobacterales bacterium]